MVLQSRHPLAKCLDVLLKRNVQNLNKEYLLIRTVKFGVHVSA